MKKDKQKKMNNLAILIPTMYARESLLDRLLATLAIQCHKQKIPVLVYPDQGHKMGGLTTGAKRNKLVEMAEGSEYVSFIDDDDLVADNYIDLIIDALRSNPDAITFKGIISVQGKKNVNEFLFGKDLEYTTSKGGGQPRYLRPPNHLCPMRRKFYLDIPFKDIVFAEDYDQCIRLRDSGLIKTTTHINQHLYFYKYNGKK